MANSDDSDKTRIQPRHNQSAPEVNEPDDRTRISPKKPADPEAEARRREAAAQKAKELEQRLAAIAAKKRQQLNEASEAGEENSNDVAVDESDKTQIAPRNTVSSGSEASEDNESDKTQFQPRPAARNTPALEDDTTATENADKTQFKPRLATKQPVASNTDEVPDDRTRIAPPRALEDSGESEPDTDDQPRDSTVFKPVPPNPEKTVVSDVPLPPGAPLEAPSAGNSGEQAARNLEGQELLKNRFLLEKVLGAGGMGMVYKATDLLKVEAQDKDPYVAIKVLNDEFKTHPDAFIALQRESRKTQRIAHPNIVNVHDFDKDGDNVFMTMEFLDGKPLDKLISQYRSTGLPEEDAWNILQGISAALIYAHGEHIIHSDFKPGNIFVTSKGIAKVFDFGIARAVAKAEKFEESVDDKTVFDAGNLGALTPAYASMEMLEGEPPDVRDDIYALGCIAYEMFTGKHPFNRTHANEAMRQKLKPERINNIPKRQWKVIEKALAFKREERIATVEEFWEQITSKRSTNVVAIVASLVVIGLGSLMVYQNYFAPKAPEFSEDDYRSELELKLRLEQYQANLEEMIANQQFDESWEHRLWSTVQALRKVMGEDPWLVEREEVLYQAYLEKIKAEIEGENFEQAKALRVNAERYSKNPEALLALDDLIAKGEKALAQRVKQQEEQARLAKVQQQKKAAAAKEQKEVNDAYAIALGTVNKQLACRTTLNMSDLTIAIEKLRSLDLGRFNKGETEMVDKLAACITKIGVSFPDRAEEFKKRSLRLFPDNKKIAYIKIEPKDPCDTSLAGLGARGKRAICRDRLKSKTDDFGRGPSMVVIPGKGSVSPFAIGKYEVSVEDMNKYCEASKKCSVNKSNQDLPVTNVSMSVMQDYLRWLSDISGYKYRLPTKAEWVYAARGERNRLDSNRNCLLNSRGIQKGGVLVKTTIGQQNDWGLVNHVGNARELVMDGGASITMGGSFETSMDQCSVTKTENANSAGDNLTGFRVFREIARRG
ncbi:Serine/threonine-protein kinase StkP [Thalassocella blandensis]|nr:Serine/threonine-protein kinase StkP [Thalassocella blandensis]